MTRYLAFGVLLAAAATACGTDDDGYRDVVGPFTGATTTYTVDHFDFPATNAQLAAISGDLDGDGVADNQLGSWLEALGSIGGDTTTDVSGGGSTLEIIADDPTTDDTVGVTYVGAAGDDVGVVGGTLAGGVFAPNPSARTHVPGIVVASLPIFLDADRSVVTMRGVEIEIAAPDPQTGMRRAIVRGGIVAAEARAAVVRGLQQMYDASPSTHTVIGKTCDTDGDELSTDAEIAACSLVDSVAHADLRMFDGDGNYAPHHVDAGGDVVSLAFAVVLAPPAL